MSEPTCGDCPWREKERLGFCEIGLLRSHSLKQCMIRRAFVVMRDRVRLLENERRICQETTHKGLNAVSEDARDAFRIKWSYSCPEAVPIGAPEELIEAENLDALFKRFIDLPIDMIKDINKELEQELGICVLRGRSPHDTYIATFPSIQNWDHVHGVILEIRARDEPIVFARVTKFPPDKESLSPRYRVERLSFAQLKDPSLTSL